MVADNKKGRICVTGGTGFLGSWMIKRLLEDGYSVNATLRIDPERKRDISFLTNLPGASERLQIFNADLDKPETFAPAIEGCTGVFHMAHPLDFAEKEPEDVKLKRVITGLKGILQACADSKTVRRVVYTASISTVAFSTTSGSDIIDESCWTDVEFIRSLKTFGGPYIVTKTLTEKAALEFAEELGLDLVSVIPTWITGPFICTHCPDSVYVSMALIFGDKAHHQHLKDTSLVHVDDVARAHINLFEYPEAKGRYICSAVEFKIEELCQFISTRYPEYQMPTEESWKDLIPVKFSGLSTKKLQETGFKYEYGLEEMFDGAIKSCKEKGLL
ncbi:Flavonol reductase/cinnamoyl-CoA reductase [Handroanthus impetiginosus]|uniref:Dihydroflavonol 4-reductase n=1 Tax=Handroanthus impetiginosus TaxID=429701 RepID=A0A2G9I215_9LAMI|nr:Flavonol reductase/cinnamoyl-CoA reductase [Handroanthus impetiginosus]